MKKILLITLTLATLTISACSTPTRTPAAMGADDWRPDRSLTLDYAQGFRVDYEGDLALLTLSDSSRFLVVPQGRDAPAGLSGDIAVLQQPLENLYVASTATMSLFAALDGLDNVRFSGAQEADWAIPAVQEAMKSGTISYGGKYSAPDYELLLKNKVALAVENTNIDSAPRVKEKLQQEGIPVLVDQSSNEPDPLGRAEWIKLYGALLGQETLADTLFQKQVAQLDQVKDQPATGKTVAYFFLSPSGYVVTPRPDSYVTKMIGLAGGTDALAGLSGQSPAAGGSSLNMGMEQFYAQAKDADVLIYNATLGEPPPDLDALIALNPLLKDFTAIRNDQVWCTDKAFYQDMTGTGTMVAEIRTMLTSPDTSLTYFHRLR